MENPEILSALTDILRDVLMDDNLTVTPALTAADVPEWDSMSHIMIMAAVEVRFGIKFKTAELEQLKNVGELMELISRKLELKVR
jgi:acyl carrier protein